MEKTIKLLGISGSLRSQSYNTMLLKTLYELLPPNTELTITSIADLPFYNGDLDIPTTTERPAAVVAFREKIAAADGLIIASPEYNYSIPGVLKNAIDWASRGDDSPILKKPVALMGVTTGQWGTVRMQLAFQPVFHTLDIKQAKPEILVAKAEEKFKDGKLIDDSAKKLIVKQLATLKNLIEHIA